MVADDTIRTKKNNNCANQHQSPPLGIRTPYVLKFQNRSDGAVLNFRKISDHTCPIYFMDQNRNPSRENRN